MPSLAPVKFWAKSVTGDEVEFVSKVSVSAVDAQFAFTIPEFLEQSARAFLAKDRATSTFTKPSQFYGIEIDQAQVNLRVTGNKHELVKAFVQQALKDHLACDIKEEEVIVYRYTSGVHYYKTAEGDIRANGVGCGVGGDWKGYKGSFSTDRREDYSLRFAAFALIKITYTRNSAESVEYRAWEPPNNQDTSDPRCRLNAFVRLYRPGVKEHNRTHPLSIAGFTVIPYTPAAADFFYGVMISLCKIDDKLSTFFDDGTKVLAAIEAKDFKLLT